MYDFQTLYKGAARWNISLQYDNIKKSPSWQIDPAEISTLFSWSEYEWGKSKTLEMNVTQWGILFFPTCQQHLVLWSFKKKWWEYRGLYICLRSVPSWRFRLSKIKLDNRLAHCYKLHSKNEATKNFKMSDAVVTNTTPFNNFDFF